MKGFVATFCLFALVILAMPASAATVDDRKWKGPVPIESRDNGDARTPQVAFDGNDNAMAVWKVVSTTDGLPHIWASRFTAANGWDGGAPIESSLSGGTTPQIAMDRFGNGTAVWAQSDGVQALRYVNGWGTTATPLQLTAVSGSTPQVATDSAGNVFVVWSQSDGAIWAKRFTLSNDSWDGAAQLDTHSGAAMSPQVAVDSKGNALAVWQDPDGRIWWNLYTLSSHGWSGAAPVETTANSATSPQVVFEA